MNEDKLKKGIWKFILMLDDVDHEDAMIKMSQVKKILHDILKDRIRVPKHIIKKYEEMELEE